MKLVLATRNRDKVTEIRAILEGLDVTLHPVDEFPGVAEVEETAETLEGNAVLKAVETARATGSSALADDTGLEVAALDGAPGVYSARFAGEGATYADNCRKLLEEMEEVGPSRREARFRTVVALAHPDGRSQTVEGVCDGEILTAMRGSGGFGYDPVFRPADFALSFAEMSLEQKNAVSHRGRAFRLARKLVEKWLQSERNASK